MSTPNTPSPQGPEGAAGLPMVVVAAREPATGIHDGEGDAGPLRVEDLAVPRHPLLLLDDGGATAHDAVDQ